MSLTRKDQALDLAVLLSFSFPRLALCWTLVYLVKHPSQKSICGCWIASGVLCRFVMFNRQACPGQQPHTAGVWTIIRVTVLLCCQVSSLCFSFPLPVPALFYFFYFLVFLVVVSGSNKLFYKRFPVRVFCSFTWESGCLINPKCERCKGNVGGKTSQGEWGRKERGHF